MHVTKSSMGQPCNGTYCDVCLACDTCSTKRRGQPGTPSGYVCAKCAQPILDKAHRNGE